MPYMLGMQLKGDAQAMAKLAESADSIFGKVSGALESERMEKLARFYGIPRALDEAHDGSDAALLSSMANPVASQLQEFIRNHPPANMEALRDLYAQATERALQKALSKIETSEDADPMGVAAKNLRRMAEILETRLDIARSQKDLDQFQREMAAQQGLSPDNPAAQAAQQLPGSAAPPTMESTLPEPVPPIEAPSPPEGLAPPPPPPPGAQ
jgi:hypothetical protein